MDTTLCLRLLVPGLGLSTESSRVLTEQGSARERVLGFTAVFILQITQCHSTDLDLSTPTKKPKAILSDNLTGTQTVHSKICN